MPLTGATGMAVMPGTLGGQAINWKSWLPEDASVGANVQGAWAERLQKQRQPHEMAMLRQQQQPEMQALGLRAAADARKSALLSQLQGQMASFQQVGGKAAPLPGITVGGVWSDPQVQQQANAMRARNDQGAATQQRDIQTQMAGRGFSSRSPLLAALQAQVGASNRAANSAGERELRWDAAQGNARHLLNTQVARQNQWAQAEDSDIRRRQLQMSGYNALLGALTGLV